MGGSKKKDDIENLMALCRECHLEYGDIQELIPTLQELHQKRMNK
jgi:5-methylcytosine-specific restriction endonuclease McrA